VLIICCFQLSAGEESECKQIKKFRANLEEKPYISFEFTQTIKSDIFETVDTVKGNLWAGEKGRFRLDSPEQTLVSDGVRFWSYSAANEQVLIDSVAKMGDWDPLTILYNPENVFRCTSDKIMEKEIGFDMQAISERTEPQSFKLIVSKSEMIPKRITYSDINGSLIDIYINKFKKHLKLSDSLFIFEAPSGVEVIEMP